MHYSAQTGGFYDPEIHGDSIPSDSVEITHEQYLSLLDAQSGGKVIKPDSFGQPIASDPPGPTPEEVRVLYEVAAQQALDNVAKSWGYDDLRSAVSYIGSKVAKWDAEGKALKDYRDDFWLAANAIKVSVQNGAVMPSTPDGFVAMLPAAPDRPS